jgi:hypothetical protein
MQLLLLPLLPLRLLLRLLTLLLRPLFRLLRRQRLLLRALAMLLRPLPLLLPSNRFSTDSKRPPSGGFFSCAVFSSADIEPVKPVQGIGDKHVCRIASQH